MLYIGYVRDLQWVAFGDQEGILQAICFALWSISWHITLELKRLFTDGMSQCSLKSV